MKFLKLKCRGTSQLHGSKSLTVTGTAYISNHYSLYVINWKGIIIYMHAWGWFFYLVISW